MADLPFRPQALTPLPCEPVVNPMPFDESRYDAARGADPQVSIFGFTTGGSVSSDRVSATRRIAAPAEKLFQIVSTPSGQVAIDGSGMLEAAPDDQPLTKVGQTFDMDMDREPLGDIPNLKKYQVRNTVTQVVPDRLIEWTVGFGDNPPFGHTYGWILEPVSQAETDVTNYCDWSNAVEDMRERMSWPVVPVAMLEKSVEKLDRIATGS